MLAIYTPAAFRSCQTDTTAEKTSDLHTLYSLFIVCVDLNMDLDVNVDLNMDLDLVLVLVHSET